MIGEILSVGSSVLLVAMAFFAAMAYRPPHWRTGDGPDYLAVAITLIAVAAAGNTIYWQLLGAYAGPDALLSKETFRWFGNYVDVIVKGGAAGGFLLAIKALHVALPESERGKWFVIEMAYYPNRSLCMKVMRSMLKNRRG